MAKSWVHVALGSTVLLLGCDEGFVRESTTFEKNLPAQFHIPDGASLLEPVTSVRSPSNLDGCEYMPSIKTFEQTAVGVAVVPPNTDGRDFFRTLFRGRFDAEGSLMLAEVPEPDALFVICAMSMGFGVPVIEQYWTLDDVVSLDYYVEKNSGDVQQGIKSTFVLLDVDVEDAEFQSRYLGLFEGNGR